METEIELRAKCERQAKRIELLEKGIRRFQDWNKELGVQIRDYQKEITILKKYIKKLNESKENGTT